MSTLDKIKMQPIILCKRNSGRIGIISGHRRVNALKFIGLNELPPDRYVFSDGSESKEILSLNELDDSFSESFINTTDKKYTK